MLECLARSVHSAPRRASPKWANKNTDGRMTKLKSFAGLASALWLALAGTANAQPMADYFRGKTLRLLTPSVPGGDRALYSLAFANFYGKHVPGNPTVQAVFMPGAGGSTAVNNAYNVAAPDGLTIVTPLAAVVMAQAVGDESVKYDVAKMSWLGRITDATSVFMVSNKVAAKSLADFRQREVVISTIAKASETYMLPAFISRIFGAACRSPTLSQWWRSPPRADG